MMETLVASDFGLTHKVQVCGGSEASRATLPGPLLGAGDCGSEQQMPREGASQGWGLRESGWWGPGLSGLLWVAA